ESERAALAGAVGGFLAALHRLDVSLVSRCGLRQSDHAGDIGRLRQAVADAADTTLPAFLRARLETCFDRYLSGPIDAAYRPAILHADLSPEHVRFDPDAAVLTGVIDWGDVRIGDPARDFIFLYEDWGTDFLGIALDAYAA